MDKLKINKIKLLDLSKDAQNKIVGGQQVAPVPISVTVVSVIAVPVVLTVIADATYGVTCYSKCDCLTANPGHQDSCGLCTTQYHC